jgi:hypothetical protein
LVKDIGGQFQFKTPVAMAIDELAGKEIQFVSLKLKCYEVVHAADAMLEVRKMVLWNL